MKATEAEQCAVGRESLWQRGWWKDGQAGSMKSNRKIKRQTRLEGSGNERRWRLPPPVSNSQARHMGLFSPMETGVVVKAVVSLPGPAWDVSTTTPWRTALATVLTKPSDNLLGCVMHSVAAVHRHTLEFMVGIYSVIWLWIQFTQGDRLSATNRGSRCWRRSSTGIKLHGESRAYKNMHVWSHADITGWYICCSDTS